MSATISQQIDTLTTKLGADIGAIATQVTGLQTQVSTLVAELVPGSVVTQAQVDALTAIETQASAIAASVVPVTQPGTITNSTTVTS